MAITLSNHYFNTNSTSNIGAFSSEVSGSYSFVGGSGSNDNDKFSIVRSGNLWILKPVEGKISGKGIYLIRVMVSNGPNSDISQLTIYGFDLRDVALSNTVISRHNKPNTEVEVSNIIGIAKSPKPEEVGTWSFSLPANTLDNNNFKITHSGKGYKLYLKANTVVSTPPTIEILGTYKSNGVVVGVISTEIELTISEVSLSGDGIILDNAYTGQVVGELSSDQEGLNTYRIVSQTDSNGNEVSIFGIHRVTDTFDARAGIDTETNRITVNNDGNYKNPSDFMGRLPRFSDGDFVTLSVSKFNNDIDTSEYTRLPLGLLGNELYEVIDYDIETASFGLSLADLGSSVSNEPSTFGYGFGTCRINNLSKTNLIIKSNDEIKNSDTYTIVVRETSKDHSFESMIEVVVEESGSPSIYVTSIAPVNFQEGSYPEIVVFGKGFLSAPELAISISMNGETVFNPLDLYNFTDTSFSFVITEHLNHGIYSVDFMYDVDVDGNPMLLPSEPLVVYTTDQKPNKDTGSVRCIVKPDMLMVVDEHGKSGKHGIIQTICPPNPNTEYTLVVARATEYVDWRKGGYLEIGGLQTHEGDIVWLTNQYKNPDNTSDNENGLYTVHGGAWTPGWISYRNGVEIERTKEVTDEVFVDLWARAYDEIDGDITRSIVTEQSINFNVPGIYTLSYYVTNSVGVLTKLTRTIRVINCDASISPTNSFSITDLEITSGIDKTIFDPGIDNECDGCNFNPIIRSTIEILDDTSFVVPTVGMFMAGILFIRRDGTTVYTADQSMGGHKLVNLGDAVDDADAVNLKQVRDMIGGGSGETQTIDMIADENISKYMVVALNASGTGVVLGNSTDISQQGRILGVATANVLVGNSVEIHISGNLEIDDVSSFENTIEYGKDLFFNSLGQLTNIPPVEGFTQKIGNLVFTEAKSYVYVKLGLAVRI